jgi:hypothetical protein
VQAFTLAQGELSNTTLDRVELRLRRQPIGRGGDDTRSNLTPEASDTNHEELVEVRAEDREKLETFQERVALVERC